PRSVRKAAASLIVASSLIDTGFGVIRSAAVSAQTVSLAVASDFVAVFMTFPSWLSESFLSAAGTGHGGQNVRAGHNAGGPALLVYHDDAVDVGVEHQLGQLGDSTVRRHHYRVGRHVGGELLRRKLV